MFKKSSIFLLLICLLVAFALSACDFGPKTSSKESSEEVSSNGDSQIQVNDVQITALQEEVELELSQIEGYDFTSCFLVTVNGEKITVLKEYLDLSELKGEEGVYLVYCNYEQVQSSISVNVYKNEYELSLSQNEISVNKSLALTYDYLALFTAKLNGKQVEITEDMINSTVKDEVGEYTFTVTFGDQEKTLTVKVNNEHELLVAVSYPIYELCVSMIEDFDYTQLFSLFVDGTATKVCTDMIDASAVKGAFVGEIKEVYFSYTLDQSSVTKSAKVKIVPEEEIVLNAKNITTYPNGGAIDLTTLFSISKGNEQIPVTSDMISGSVNYSVAGDNVITLNYQGQTVTAVVQVVVGVVVNYRQSDTVIIRKGTDISTYPFEKDFVVVINGIRFTMIADYIDSSAVDFTTAGSYQAVLKIPYNDKKFGISGNVNFGYYQKNINYVVVENEYTIDVSQDLVTLKKGTTSYNPFNNIEVTINGRNQTLTDNPAYVDRISCYAKVVSAPIDFKAVGVQTVTVEIYVNGVETAPEVVSYEVIIESDVLLTSTNSVIFTGESLMATKLFNLTVAGEQVPLTFDMITGKLDCFTPGVYQVSATYEGITATARVVVISNEIKGIYKTNLYAIPDSNSSYDEEYGDQAPAKGKVGAMTVNEAGEIYIKGVKADIVDALSESVLRINYRSNLHTLYYENGIIVIVPDNQIKLNYYEEKRPYIYFNESIWKIARKTIVNQYDYYVLESSIVCYSFDVFTLRHVKTNEEMVYLLKVHLVSKISADTEYVVTWGEASFKEGFIGKAGESSVLTFNGEEYPFTMKNGETGTIPKPEDEERLFANTTFKGVVNGKSATLVADQYQAFTLTVEGQKIFHSSYYEISSMKNGGVNYQTGEVLLYYCDTRDDTFYSYKFIVDPKTKTFEYIAPDNLLGFYEANNAYVMLDGYGTGYINFNSSSYSETTFNYTSLNGILTFNYKNILPGFPYGESSQFALDSFGNVLTVHSGLGLKQGERFVNRYIQSGIVVEVNIETIGANNDTLGKEELYRAITIIGSDGELTKEQKKEYVDTSTLRFNTPGFYRFTISASVYGEKITSYYAIQVLPAVYAGSDLVASYGQGVIYPQNALIIDEFGRLTVTAGNDYYVGAASVAEDNSFTAEVYGAKGVATISGSLIAKGLIQVRATGAISYLDYYTTGTAYLSGKEKTVLRTFVLKEQTVFILATSESSATGEVVSVECTNGKNILEVGSILKITSKNAVTVVKTVKFNDAKNGLVLSDNHHGVFTGAGETLTVDGFGGIKVGNQSATYVVNGGYKITVILNGQPTVYALNTQDYTYTVVDIAFDASLVQGKTYTSTYYFSCNEYLYQATTTLTFMANGKVRVVSTSTEHDSGDDRCYIDVYNPPFSAVGGSVGSYGVFGTKVTVTVNGYTFVFNITNVIRTSELVCENNGSLSEETHGYFAIGTKFAIVEQLIIQEKYPASAVKVQRRLRNIKILI